MIHVTIHRGTKQIGGCVTEIATDASKVFIDIGENLPGVGAALPPVDGLTAGSASGSALFLTHYHGDHLGLLNTVMPEIPVWTGETTKAIHLNYTERVQRGQPHNLDRIQTFKALDKIEVGDIAVTPLMIDHSAFDAYMFITEARGYRVLHTGDFRLHGFRSGKTLKMLSFYARDIDYIICEGTTLSRDEPPMSERQLQQKAAEIMRASKYVFVLCSSTNIDRIGAFYHANPRGRLFVCDLYQKKQMETVRAAHADKSSFYDFKRVFDYAPNLDELMEKQGFCMLVRQGEFFREALDKYKGRSLLIYSMWTGYLDERAKNQGLCDFLAPYDHRVLHTSGHASPQDLKRVYECVNPKRGLIPIHTEAPEVFREFVQEDRLVLLNDGDVFSI